MSQRLHSASGAFRIRAHGESLPPDCDFNARVCGSGVRRDRETHREERRLQLWHAVVGSRQWAAHAAIAAIRYYH